MIHNDLITPPFLRGESARQERSSQSSRWGDIKRQHTQNNLKFAQELRQNVTDVERLLWYHLRNKQLGGYKFRRQQPIEKYIVDFVCMSNKLIVELDGSHHAEQQAADLKRAPSRNPLHIRSLPLFEGESARQERSSQSSRWGDIKRQYTQNNLKFAQELRQNVTDVERLLWCWKIFITTYPPTASTVASGLVSATPPQKRGE